MVERSPRPEIQRASVVESQWADLANPAAYIEAAQNAVEALKQLVISVEK